MNYNWDLMETLLHKIQQSANHSFAPRADAEVFAHDQEQLGQPVGNLDALKQEATDYERLLVQGSFIAPRPQEEGGNGENYVLTKRGLQLLSLIDSSFPGSTKARQLFDKLELAALVPEVFDEAAEQAARA